MGYASLDIMSFNKTLHHFEAGKKGVSRIWVESDYRSFTIFFDSGIQRVFVGIPFTAAIKIKK